MEIFSCAIHLTEITFTVLHSMHANLYIIYRIEKKETKKQTKEFTTEEIEE